MSEARYQQTYNTFEDNMEMALLPLPKDLPNLSFRLVSDGTPVGTHVVVYDPKTKKDVGELTNVQALSFKMSIDDVVCDVEMLCVDIPMNLEFGKPKYAIGSADPVSLHKMMKTGVKVDERLIQAE